MAEVTDDRLRLLIERIERIEEEENGLKADKKDVYLEAKAVGYDAKIMRQIVRLRKMDPDTRREMETILDLYKCALGLGFESTPLAQAAAEREAARAVPDASAEIEPEPAAKPAADPDLYPEARRLVTEHNKASISWLQRQLRIGFNSAALLVTRLETEGIVGPANHVGRREVLVERVAETAH